MGYKNSIEAVVRCYKGLKDQFTWEMLINPELGYNKFSTFGDSGSCVFHPVGTTAGLVPGSTIDQPEGGKEEWRDIPQKTLRKLKTRAEDAEETPSDDVAGISPETDVTFATPIGWVLEDIEKFTGLKPRLV
ncbi:hypothetical protein F5Y02DRAFT_391453 [Annulohypoxylon stygium]|nr:hypothetical protein F5Y02DRAFT_391453 [Annulohypoxylon stygium]